MALAGTLLLLTVLVVGVYIFAAPLLEDLVARNLQSRLGLESAPEISLEDGPTSLLTGRFDGGRVVLPGFDFGDVRPEKVSVELAPFDLNVPGSLTSGQLQTRTPLSGTLRVTLSEAEVTRVASTGATDFPVRNVDLEEGVTVVTSETFALGQSIPVSVEGPLDLQNNSLVFEPRRVEALGLPVPAQLTGQLLQGTSFVYPIEPLSGGGMFTGVDVLRDQLVVTGEINNLALL
ncbi:MAG TPA: DUF2993 domain-containing protein [Rubrobacter sp.]|nr:DUF2993 domain-containing protein [Rubrobacter sp.]